MRVAFESDGWDDYLYWQSHDRKILTRINKLIKDIIRDPFAGIGRPEPLKDELSGYWSRRINREHRLVYTVRDDLLVVIQCRYHY